MSVHTAVHWGPDSDPREFGQDIGPADSRYTEFTSEFAQGNFALPREFTASITFPTAGTYFYRFHAVVDGVNFWSPEYQIQIE